MTFFLLLLGGCFQVQNSFENDRLLYSPEVKLDLSDPQQLRLQRAREVFAKYNCVSCHASNPLRFQGFSKFTDAQWSSVSCGDPEGGPCVDAGHPATSYLYKRMHKPSCSPTANLCDMPSEQISLEASDVEIIENWIEGLE
jgi:hypothetical protein